MYVAEFDDAEVRRKYPLQVISAASHYFIGASFQHVPRLQEMAARRPTSVPQLSGITGFGPARIETYGEGFVSVIRGA